MIAGRMKHSVLMQLVTNRNIFMIGDQVMKVCSGRCAGNEYCQQDDAGDFLYGSCAGQNEVIKIALIYRLVKLGLCANL